MNLWTRKSVFVLGDYICSTSENIVIPNRPVERTDNIYIYFTAWSLAEF